MNVIVQRCGKFSLFKAKRNQTRGCLTHVAFPYSVYVLVDDDPGVRLGLGDGDVGLGLRLESLGDGLSAQPRTLVLRDLRGKRRADCVTLGLNCVHCVKHGCRTRRNEATRHRFFSDVGVGPSSVGA